MRCPACCAPPGGWRRSPCRRAPRPRWRSPPCKRLGGELLVIGDARYPALLAQLADPPPVLSVLGQMAVLQQRAVGIVGSRNASANGQTLAETLAEALARAGVVVVSGLARGIDAAAHAGALRGGATVAAVAGGLDVPYPPEHAGLQRQIAAGGAVVTEAPPGTQPQSRHFPRRNRIIAGLALGVVVVEAAPRSGSLITARLALEAGATCSPYPARRSIRAAAAPTGCCAMAPIWWRPPRTC